MTPLPSLVVYMAIVIWASLLAASLIRTEGRTLATTFQYPVRLPAAHLRHPYHHDVAPRDIRIPSPKTHYRRSRTLAGLSTSHHHKLGNPDIPYFGSGSGWLKRSQRATRSLL